MKVIKYFLLSLTALFIPFLCTVNSYATSRGTENAASIVAALTPAEKRFRAQNNIIFTNDPECDPTASLISSVSTSAKPSGDQITWIGDSYSVRAFNYNQLTQKFGDGLDYGGKENVDTSSGYIQVGKSFGGTVSGNPSGIEVATRIKNSIRPYLVFALGTNNIGSSEATVSGYINDLLSLAPGSKIILVTAKDNRNSDYSGVNNAIKNAQSSHNDKIFVADWASVASSEDYDSDNLHLTQSGSQKWINLIYDALPGSSGPATIAGGVTTATYKGHTIAFPIAGASKSQQNSISTIPCNHPIGCHYGAGAQSGNANAAFDICWGGDCKNQTVVSITDGTITRDIQTTRNGANCNHVRIRSDIDGTVIAYMHLTYEDLSLKAGDHVSAGQVIGHINWGDGASGAGPCNDNSVAHVHIDKGTDRNADGGPSESARDPELVQMINTVYAALPESGTVGSTNTENTSSTPSLSPTSNSTNNNAGVAWNTIAQAGISGVSDNPAAIAGIVGNFMQESGGGTFDIDPFICSPAGYLGIFQTGGSRSTDMKSFMSANGSSWKDGCSMKASGASQDEIIKAVEAETKFMLQESVFESFTKNLDKVTNKTPESYAELFLVTDEIAYGGSSNLTDPGVASLARSLYGERTWQDADKRSEYAKKAYEAFSNGTYSYQSSSSTSDPCPNETQSSSLCSGGLSSGGMTLEQAQSFMKTYADEAAKGTTGTVTLDGVSITDSGCTGAKGSGIGGALNNCSAFSAWFINRYTSVTNFPVTQGSQTVNKLVSEYGFNNLSNKPEVYSIVSMGPETGSANGWANHTGVVLGIDEANDKIIIGEASCSLGYATDGKGWQWPGVHEYSLKEYSEGGTYAPVYASTNGFLKELSNTCSGSDNVDISSLSLEEKVAQLFIIYANEFTSFKDSTGSTPGGVIFMNEGGDLSGGRNSVKQKIGSMQSEAKEKMFIAVDEEGGTVARLANAGLCSDIGNASSLNSVNAAKTAGSTVGDCMKGLGFNVDFAPVADTLYEAGSSVLANRVFANSSDPNTVAKLSTAFGSGLESKGVIAVYKHFPGHGSSASDTHTGGASTSKTWSQLKNEDIIPFKSAIDSRAKMIMAAHITTADSNGPASMSSKYLTDYLRGELGYKGLIVTDALNMGAATQASSTPALAAFKAGADLLLMPNNPSSAYNSILNAVKSGEIPESRLNESVQRILNAKKGL